MPGKVFLVGAGPGDPELLTVKALKHLSTAEVVVHDRLVSDAVLAIAPPRALMIPVGKAPGRHTVPQEEISALLVALAGRFGRVVRLKGGDPFIFGRGGEEAEALGRANIPYEVVPGITAAQGASAATGVPLTHRGLATGVRYLTGHCRSGLPLNLDWAGLADPDTTLVVYMGAASIGVIGARLIDAGADPALPVLAVASATTPAERRLRSSLGRIGDEVAKARLPGPLLVIIGLVASLCHRRPIDSVLPERVLETASAAGHA